MSMSPRPFPDPHDAPPVERIGRNGLPIKPEPVAATAASSSKQAVWWVVAVIGMLVFLWPSKDEASTAHMAALQTAEEGNNPCAGKARCLVAVVAPWCGACRRSKGFIQQLQAQVGSDPGSGMRIVVSGDQPDALRRYASEFDDGTALIDDEQGGFARSVGVSAFPTFVVLDERGTVAAKTVGAPSQADDVETTAWLRRSLQWSEAAGRR
jgi:hypothetical protein